MHKLGSNAKGVEACDMCSVASLLAASPESVAADEAGAPARSCTQQAVHASAGCECTSLEAVLCLAVSVSASCLALRFVVVLK